MVLSNPLSYESLKCIAASLDYNIRLQLTKRCPSFLTIHKATPTKVNKVLVTNEHITIESTSYQMSACFLQGYTSYDPLLLLTVNAGNSKEFEWLDNEETVKDAIDYLIQIFFGKRSDNYTYSVKQTLEPDDFVVNALCFSFVKLTYPFLNTARKLNVNLCVLHDHELLEVTNPRVSIGVVDENIITSILKLIVISQLINHSVHYSFELASMAVHNNLKTAYREMYGEPTKKIFSDGTFHGCNNLRREKSGSLEVNVYLEEEMEEGRNVYSVHIIVCPEGTAIPIEDN